MIGCIVVSDRGDLYLPGCINSLQENVRADFTEIVDDHEHKLGMAGAVRRAWQWALDSGCDYLFHVEEDFRFLQPVDLDSLRYTLDRNPLLAQVVLKRQPVNDEEIAAGGIIESHPDDYTECKAWGRNIIWTEHSRIFSLNPCLIPRRVLELGWPDGNEAEFTQRCIDAGYRFAFYGARHAPPVVEHVGEVRAVGWRL